MERWARLDGKRTEKCLFDLHRFLSQQKNGSFCCFFLSKFFCPDTWLVFVLNNCLFEKDNSKTVLALRKKILVAGSMLEDILDLGLSVEEKSSQELDLLAKRMSSRMSTYESGL